MIFVTHANPSTKGGDNLFSPREVSELLDDADKIIQTANRMFDRAKRLMPTNEDGGSAWVGYYDDLKTRIQEHEEWMAERPQPS